MGKYTAGPFEICKPFKRDAVYMVNIVKGLDLFAVAVGKTENKCLDNANLIASAPELLEALKEAESGLVEALGDLTDHFTIKSE